MNLVEASELATAAGTLVLAIATFSSIRAAQTSTKLAERALLAAQRPLLIPSHVDDPAEKVRFGDGVYVKIEGHRGSVVLQEDALYMAISLRNGGSGIAVIHSWRVLADWDRRLERPEDIDVFRQQVRDLYIPAGSTGFWQGAIRDPADPDNAAVRARAAAGERIFVDLLYGDQDGGQRTVARFGVPTFVEGAEQHYERVELMRYWAVDGEDPRQAPERATDLPGMMRPVVVEAEGEDAGGPAGA